MRWREQCALRSPFSRRAATGECRPMRIGIGGPKSAAIGIHTPTLDLTDTMRLCQTLHPDRMRTLHRMPEICHTHPHGHMVYGDRSNRGRLGAET